MLTDPIKLIKIPEEAFSLNEEFQFTVASPKEGYEYKYQEFKRDTVYPVEQRGKILYTSEVSKKSTVILMKFHRFGETMAVHGHYDDFFLDLGRRIRLPEDEKVSVILLTQSNAVGREDEAVRLEDLVKGYFCYHRSAPSISFENIEFDGSEGFLSVLYDPRCDLVFLVNRKSLEQLDILQLSAVFNHTWAQEQEMKLTSEETVQACQTTAEAINGLSFDQKWQLARYLDAVINLVGYISFEHLFSLSEGERIVILDHAEEMKSLLQIFPGFLNDFCGVEWPIKNNLLHDDNLLFTKELVKAIAALPADKSISDEIRREFYSNVDKLYCWLKAGYSLLALLEVKSEIRVFLLDPRHHNLFFNIIDMKLVVNVLYARLDYIGELIKAGVPVTDVLSLESKLLGKLFKQRPEVDASVITLINLGLKIAAIMNLSAVQQGVMMENLKAVEQFTQSRATISEIAACTLDEMDNLFALPVDKVVALLMQGKKISEIASLTVASSSFPNCSTAPVAFFSGPAKASSVCSSLP